LQYLHTTFIARHSLQDEVSHPLNRALRGSRDRSIGGQHSYLRGEGRRLSFAIPQRHCGSLFRDLQTDMTAASLLHVSHWRLWLRHHRPQVPMWQRQVQDHQQRDAMSRTEQAVLAGGPG
jgi:hypothetical protein